MMIDGTWKSKQQCSFFWVEESWFLELLGADKKSTKTPLNKSSAIEGSWATQAWASTERISIRVQDGTGNI
jgi:hypothetical protein